MERHYLSTLFFFSSRRRHTRWPRDWSSDVCSSDLTARPLAACWIGGWMPSPPMTRRWGWRSVPPGPAQGGETTLGEVVTEGLVVGDGEGVGIGPTDRASVAARASAPFGALAPMTTW